MFSQVRERDLGPLALYQETMAPSVLIPSRAANVCPHKAGRGFPRGYETSAYYTRRFDDQAAGEPERSGNRVDFVGWTAGYGFA